MASRIVARLHDLALTVRYRPLALGYALAISLSNVIMALLPDHDQLSLAQAASTNIAHLATDPLVVLPASAFVDVGTGWLWVPLSLILLGGLETRLGWRRALAIVFGAHVIASLLSESMLLVQIASHAVPHADVALLDVGPSYVLLAALAGCLMIGSWRLRVAAVLAGAMVIPSSLEGLTRLDMSAVGHTCAMAFGALLTVAYSTAARREVLADAALETLELAPAAATRVLQPARA